MDITEVWASQPDTVTSHDGHAIRIRWDATYRRPSRHTMNAVDVIDHALCASIDGPHQLAIDGDVVEDIADHVPTTWFWRPTEIDGIHPTPESLAHALAILLDTARARRAAARVRDRQSDMMRQRLGDAAASLRAVDAMPHGGQRYLELQTRRARLYAQVAIAAHNRLLTEEEITGLTDIGRGEIDQIVADLPPDISGPPAVYLDSAAVAARLGVQVATINRYLSAGSIPDPDIRLGGNPGWLLDTIEGWIPRRSGGGARTDLGDQAERWTAEG